MRELSYAEALNEALQYSMCTDDRVFIIGEDVGVYGGAFGVSAGLIDEFGSERVRDTPISEAAIAGACIGSAMTGMRPVGEIQFMDFVTISMEQLILQASKIHFMFGGKASVPMVLRMPGGAGTGAAAQHSQSLENLFVHIPGLKVVMPSNPYDAKGLLLASIEDENPVMFIEHKLLYKQKGDVPEGYFTVPLSETKVAREGEDLTIVATSQMVQKSLQAAEQLTQEGIEAAVIDPRTLMPLDEKPIIESIKQTGRALVVHEAVGTGGYGGEIVARIMASEAFAYLDAPVRRLTSLDSPVPYSRPLEIAMIPQVEDIIEEARNIVNWVY